MSQLSFVQTDSDDDDDAKKRPIVPSSSKKGYGKKQQRKSGKSIRPGATIQAISRREEEDTSESKALSRESTPQDRDRTRFTSNKAPVAKKAAPRKVSAVPTKRPLPFSTKKQPPVPSAGTKKTVKDPPHSVESVHPTQDMEVPYAINLGIEGDENLIMACALSDCPKEPLNPGDVIHYFHPAFAAGSELSIRVTQVIATDPSKVDFPLVLDNGELIPRDTRMRRLKEYDNGKLYNHPGIFRDLENFRMKKRGLSSAERKMLPNARQKTLDLLNAILDKANEKLENLPSEIMNMTSPPASSQKKRKASSEPMCQTQSNNSESSCSSSSDSSDESVSANKSPRPTMSMASRFSIETQQNRKHLSPSHDSHQEEKKQKQLISDDSKSPNVLVLKNFAGLKRNPKNGHKEKVEQGKSGFAAERNELSKSEKESRADKDSSSSEDGDRTSQQITLIDSSSTRESKGRANASTTERRSLDTPLCDSRASKKVNAAMKPKVYDLDLSDSDSDEDLKHPVFSSEKSKHHGDITSKSKIASTSKSNATSTVSTKKTPRWSLDSLDKKNNADDLWDSCESDDDDSTRLSVVKKRRLTKASPSQSSDTSVAQSRRKKLMTSAFLPAALETQDSFCTSNNVDVAPENDEWEYQPKFLKERTPQNKSQDEDIDGFSSQETPGYRSHAWRSHPHKKRKTDVATSTLKFQRISNNNRY